MAGISYGLVVGRRPLSARGQAPIAGERGSPCQLLSFAELLERVLGPQCSAPRFMALPCHGRVEMWRGGNRLGIAVVVTLENLGYGQDRLGDMGQELKGNIGLVLERMAISILVVGFVEEFIFRGFIMSRLANIFGGSQIAWAVALVGQAALFGLSHGYQQLYGMVLTGAIGLFLGGVYLITGRNLWIVIIGHGFYDAAHAAYLGMMR